MSYGLLQNLSYFTYGQGYFSPQNYVSVSLPVSLTENMITGP